MFALCLTAALSEVRDVIVKTRFNKNDITVFTQHFQTVYQLQIFHKFIVGTHLLQLRRNNLHQCFHSTMTTHYFSRILGSSYR